jgi:hypothetical protein
MLVSRVYGLTALLIRSIEGDPGRVFADPDLQVMFHGAYRVSYYPRWESWGISFVAD